ncbi:hypothetical protein NRIC0776_13430 [Apilactobacillus kunkeei]
MLLELDDIEDELLLVVTVELVAFELLDSAVLWVWSVCLTDANATVPRIITATIDITEMITFLLFKIALPLLFKYVITLEQ